MTYSLLSRLRRVRWRRVASFVRLVAPSALVLALSLACGASKGERLATRTCPPGERCYFGVPGLWFTGNLPDSHDLLPIALGGVERVAFYPPTPPGEDGGTRTDVDAGGPALPDFAVSSTTGAVEILGSRRFSDSEGSATLRGAATGTAMLRVTARSSGGLLDRIEVRVTPAVGVDLHAWECLWVSREPTPDETTSSFNAHDGRCGAVWAGSHVRAGANLVGAGGETLWDDTLTHEGVAPTELFFSVYPALIVDVLAPTSGTLDFELSGLSGVHFARLPVVSDVADIWLDGDSSTSRALPVGVPSRLCAEGLFGAADGSGGAILGAPAVFASTDAGLTLVPPTDVPGRTGSATACWSVTLTEYTPQQLTVTMGSVSKVFSVTADLTRTTALRRGRTTAMMPVAMRSVRKPQPGERLAR